MNVVLTEDYASEIVYSNKGDFIEDENGKNIYKIEETEEFSGDGKYQHAQVIFSDNDGNFYCLNASRSGSHFTEWYIEYELTCPQVFRKERVITEVYYE